MRRVLDLLLALVIGGATAWGAVALAERPADPAADLPPTGDRIAAVVEALRQDPVHVAADAHDLVTEEQLARIEELVGQGELPVRVAFLGGTDEGGYADEAVALDQIMAGVGEDGVYVLWTGPEWRNEIDARGRYEVDVGSYDLLGQPDARIADVVAATADPYDREGDDGLDYWGGVGGAIAAGSMIAGLAYGGLLLLMYLVRGLAGRGAIPARRHGKG